MIVHVGHSLDRGITMHDENIKEHFEYTNR